MTSDNNTKNYTLMGVKKDYILLVIALGELIYLGWYPQIFQLHVLY